MATNHTVFQNIQLAISAYAQERWTEQKRINSTGMVTSDASIDVSGENFFGQFRWHKPTVMTENEASLTDATDGTVSTIATDVANFIKNLRTLGFRQVNMQEVVSKVDGIPLFSERLAVNRAQNENEGIFAALKGVAGFEASLGGGIVSFDTVPSATTGAFIDLNAAGAFGAAATGSSDKRGLLTTAMGASAGDSLFRSVGMAFKDYEPDYMYMITDPETYAGFRAKNLIDEDRIVDGNIEFQTLYNGKFRLVMTRQSQGNFAASANVNDQSTKTTFLVKPGSLLFTDVPNPMPTEIDRNAKAYRGGGTTEIWYRYGFVSHPMGYDWVGDTDDFATNNTLSTAASWERKVDPLNLGILPIFHA